MLRALTRSMGWILLSAACGVALGQGTGVQSRGVAERRAQATALRDSFVNATVSPRRRSWWRMCLPMGAMILRQTP
jgi:hypothetical protein